MTSAGVAPVFSFVPVQVNFRLFTIRRTPALMDILGLGFTIGFLGGFGFTTNNVKHLTGGLLSLLRHSAPILE